MGVIRIDLKRIDLTKLMGGLSLTMNSVISFNGIGFNLHTLIDTGAGALVIINTRIINEVKKALQIPLLRLPSSFKVNGFDAVERTIAAHYISAHFRLDKRMFWNMPFVALDIGNHDCIVGRLF